MTKQEYEKLLKEHDWQYRNSHSSIVYDKGLENENKLKKLAEGNKVFQALFNKYDSQ